MGCHGEPEFHSDVIKRFHLIKSVENSRYTGKFSETFTHYEDMHYYRWVLNHKDKSLPIWDATVDESDPELARIKAVNLVDEVRQATRKSRTSTMSTESYNSFCEKELSKIAMQSGLTRQALVEEYRTGNYGYQGIIGYQLHEGKFRVIYEGIPALVFPDKNYFLKMDSEYSANGYSVTRIRSESNDVDERLIEDSVVRLGENDLQKYPCSSLAEYISRRYFYQHADSVAEKEAGIVTNLLLSVNKLTKQELNDPYIRDLLKNTRVGETNILELIVRKESTSNKFQNMGSSYY
ncbi:hypothetical protein D5R81_17405 [Parashewanella spongiae]|uniref:Uncharacterized protein n=2 Tax=Parashewanella spongiae TaxID=342950 RepID=A0A3A6TFD1_9GAMM|nr:hypothetical protein D5R81_17405 [Parashewanella spongiae]